MKRKTVFKAIAITGLLGFGVFWILTLPRTVTPAQMAALTGDPAKGALVFAAGGCASCHADKDGDKTLLGGGRAFPSSFGTFYAPNISPDTENGIGDWRAAEFATALRYGVSPDKKHYYPAFPYTAYQNMMLSDIADLFAYIRTLPPQKTVSRPHDVAFPFSIRRGLGLWKALFMTEGFQLADAGLTPAEKRGRYLVEALGHCGECHTPRHILGGLQRDRWLAGAPNPQGRGTIPNITPHANGLADWTEIDIAAYLKTGFTPSYDSAGGSMAEVVENISQLPDSDRLAIAAYLRKIPSLPKP